MKKRKLGKQGLEVSELGLGCMGMSEFYGPGNQFESEATIDRAIDLGMTFFDTADIYGPFTNEELVGRALVPHRRPRGDGRAGLPLVSGPQRRPVQVLGLPHRAHRDRGLPHQASGGGAGGGRRQA